MIQQVLYRVWRPQDFGELAGQEHIRRTLENEILQDRISHAYLFTGPKGTGKTSTARILAKALNCGSRQGAGPCGECESCKTITGGNSLDVLEIDGASNRGIEEIRELKEKIGFLPALGKYKIYIIDEVHMLTAEAFNALLKTLEEPPDHVIFMLATTDPQKMPPTVLSRCQRFDFRKLSHEAIERRLGEILASLGRQAEAEALSLIIRQADGSLRDAISLLDQCLSFTPDTLTLDEACAILGMVRQEALASLLAAVMKGEAASLFTELEALFAQGVDPVQLMKEFAGYSRDLLLMALCGRQTDLVAASGRQRELMAAQCEGLGPARLQQILHEADQAAAEGRYRGNSRYMAEALFAGLLLAHGSGAQAAAAGQGSGAQEAGAQAAVAATGIGAQAAAAATQAAHAPAMAATPPETPGDAVHTAKANAPAAGKQPAASAAATPAPLKQAAADLADAADAGIEASPSSTVSGALSKPATAAPQEDVSPATAATPQDAPASTPAPIATAPGSLPDAQWEQIMQTVKSQKIILHALLSAALEKVLSGDTLSIYFDREKGGFHKDRCQETENIRIIAEAAQQALGSQVKILCDFQPGQTLDPIQKAIDIFGEDIVKVVD
ncbi:MAG: DNA polymerase III subunit gamma/tau [Clostridiales bacterium]|nr:DNA polymerase III subunit gamma/tau [Clostridiales bacterium]